VRFHAEHRFHASPQAVAALLVDPSFYVALALPDLSPPDVLEHHIDGPAAVLVLRYEFVGSLDVVARRLLGSNQLAWIQKVHVSLPTGEGGLSFAAEAHPKALHGTADFVFVVNDTGAVRRLNGELVVAAPLIGPSAERRIVPGLLRRLDIEARALENKLCAGG
jgi:hypothetical protein